MLEAVLLVGGFMVGVAVGRWWALLAAAALGIWIASVSEVEVSPWFLGAAYAVLSGIGIALGVGVRRGLRTRRSR